MVAHVSVTIASWSPKRLQIRPSRYICSKNINGNSAYGWLFIARKAHIDLYIWTECSNRLYGTFSPENSSPWYEQCIRGIDLVPDRLQEPCIQVILWNLENVFLMQRSNSAVAKLSPTRHFVNVGQLMRILVTQTYRSCDGRLDRSRYESAWKYENIKRQ